MKKSHLFLPVIAMAVAFSFSASAAVQTDGLYHNSTSLYASAADEALPVTLTEGVTNHFLEVDYATTNVTIYFMTDSPAGGADEPVETYVRLYSNKADWPAGSWVGNVVLDAATNQFHSTPAAGSDTLDLWKATWKPPRGFAGLVYYAIQVKATDTNTSVADIQYLVSGINTNVGWSGALNDTYWQSNAQYVAETSYVDVDFTGVDYTFEWTNMIPLNFDYFYFNSTNSGLPETEDIPGLAGRKFFEFNTNAAQPSYVHILAPRFGLDQLNVRIWFAKQGGGGAERIVAGSWLTNVVIDSAAPFHGLPTEGSITVDVWQAAFYPPTGTEALYYAPRIYTPEDGTKYLVSAPSPGGVVNNWTTNAQLLADDFTGRDWAYTPATVFSNGTAVNTDWAYMSNTNLDPQTEQIPGTVTYGSFSGGPFLVVDYAKTTTSFYVITDKPLNLIPGEWPRIQARISYNATGAWETVWREGAWVANLSITSTAAFHGLPADGAKEVDLWKVDWVQPMDELGNPRTNAFNVYFSFLLNTYASSAQDWQTDYIFLTKTGSIANNYLTDPQYFDPDPVDKDFFYVNQWVLPPAERILQAIALAAGEITATLDSSIDTRIYKLQFTTNLAAIPQIWTEADSLQGVNGVLNLSDTNLTDAARMYRVLETMP
ncbi:MAG: hypothetical protein AB7T27_12270 [Kiritimatiellia bacterium]